MIETKTAKHLTKQDTKEEEVEEDERGPKEQTENIDDLETIIYKGSGNGGGEIFKWCLADNGRRLECGRCVVGSRETVCVCCGSFFL